MLSIFESIRCARKIAISASIVLAAGLFASPGHAQTVFTGLPAGAEKIVCVTGSGSIYIINSSDDCTISDPADSDFPSGFSSGNATFSDVTNRTDISGGTLLVDNVTTTFSGGTTGFSSPVTFSGSSVTVNSNATFGNASTFNALADFNNGITSNTITNSGTISTATLSATTIIGSDVTASGAFHASPATNVDMGNNIVHFVAAGVANTDAVNVGQLNAATAGITTNVTALQTLTATHTTQISALQAADTVFTNSIDALELTVEGLDQRIGKVDDRASAGTAAAIALSGAMFLPGKSFNLTGNIASYRGARAAAIQFGALVSDNVALNAGISHGFNKGGKTGLRAGFTIGW